MKQSMNSIVRFVRDEEAATAAEYGIIAALVGGALLFATGKLGSALRDLFQNLASKLNIS
jgi:pilus assembly protein Flp/PilA